MSAHFDVNEISFFGLDEWSVAVCAWRGCCIEVFSRAEHSVADCLSALEGTGLSVGRDARHPFASARLKALAACITPERFGGHGKAALERIAEWEALHDTRAPLAHGQIKASRQGVTIRHRSFDGKIETRHPPMQLSRIEMLDTLAALEAAQTRLHHQLGQIKALAAKAKVEPCAPSKPGPRSSPG